MVARLLRSSGIALFVLVCSTTALYIPSYSYLDDVELNYKNGTWRCDLLICPNSTYACTILKVNDPKRPHLLNRTNICYDRNWNITGSHSQPENMPAPQPSSVYVALHSRVNATLDWSISYGLKSQFVNASLEPQNFSVLKQDTRNLINAMDNSWSQINRTFRRKNRD